MDGRGRGGLGYGMSPLVRSLSAAPCRFDLCNGQLDHSRAGGRRLAGLSGGGAWALVLCAGGWSGADRRRRPSPARGGGRSGLKQESSPAQWVAGTLARVNLVARPVVPGAGGGRSVCHPRSPGWGPRHGARHISTGVTGSSRGPGRRGGGRLCGQSGWRHRVVPRLPAHAICRWAVATVALPRRRRGAGAARGRLAVPMGAVISFPSVVPPLVASHPRVPVGDPSALELGLLPAGRKSPDDFEILAGWAGGYSLRILHHRGGCACPAGQRVRRSQGAVGCGKQAPHELAAPTATPITAAERAWVAGIAHLQKKIDKPFTARAMTMTRAKMTQLESATGGCSRELRRMGEPGTRLQSVYATATEGVPDLSEGGAMLCQSRECQWHRRRDFRRDATGTNPAALVVLRVCRSR